MNGAKHIPGIRLMLQKIKLDKGIKRCTRKTVSLFRKIPSNRKTCCLRFLHEILLMLNSA